MFEPWIGKHYATTRLLLLGESAYRWEENGEKRLPSPKHSIEMVQRTVERFPHCGSFFAMISRALANDQNPTRDRLSNVWDAVAFTNYVADPVEGGPRYRPTAAMWNSAKVTFLEQLQTYELNPKRIIILGTTMWGNLPETDIHITDEVQAYRNGDDIIMCHAVNHPAGGLSWRKLASVIHFTYEEQFRA